MKKVIKSRIFIFLMTAIIFTSIGAYAATTYNATDVLYTSSDGTSMTVNDALNELYENNKEYYVNGLVAYYNPVSGEKCKVSEAVSTTGTKTGCMKWYIYKDDGKNYTMILDHNTTAKLAWNASNSNVAFEESNLKSLVDKLVSESKWADTPRLITAEEVAQITGNTSWTNTGDSFYFDSNSMTKTATSKGASKYAWLFDYTEGCTSYGCNTADSSTVGYWTSTPQGIAGSGKGVWSVVAYGLLDSYQAFRDTHHGIRPVITIPKSRLS